MNKRLKKKKGISKITAKECWNLDYTLSKLILPRLIKFKEIVCGYPGNLNSFQEWEEILDKMIWSFDYHVKISSAHISYEEIKHNQPKYEEGMKLFIEYYGSLWY